MFLILPDGFNWLDIVIGLFLIVSLLQGIRKGLIRSVFTVIGITAGLAAAIKYYAPLSEWVLSYIGIPRFIADTFSFLVVFSFAALCVHFIGMLFAVITRIKLIRAVDRIGGSAAGLAIGLAVAGAILILLTAFPLYPGFQDHVEQSYLAPPIIETTHAIYSELSEILPLELPRLAIHPEDLTDYFNNISTYPEHSGVDFAGLDGTVCLVCDGPVQFLGYMDNNMGSISPKFACTVCGRTSDGCQTYEGYHLMYDQCPVILGNRGYRLDCGIWTNNSYHRPTGPCPVCGAD